MTFSIDSKPHIEVVSVVPDTNDIVLMLHCSMCQGREQITLPLDLVDRWINNNEKIQDVLGFLSADDREWLISGTCPRCWNAMFAESA